MAGCNRKPDEQRLRIASTCPEMRLNAGPVKNPNCLESIVSTFGVGDETGTRFACIAAPGEPGRTDCIMVLRTDSRPSYHRRAKIIALDEVVSKTHSAHRSR